MTTPIEELIKKGSNEGSNFFLVTSTCMTVIVLQRKIPSSIFSANFGLSECFGF